MTGNVHNHRQCVREAMTCADRVCQRQGGRLTQLRREVLANIWEGHNAVKAYDLLETMAIGGERPKPPTVYRALNFLLEQGLVHRLESLNAYVGCSDPEQAHVGQFLICLACGEVRELHMPAVQEAVRAGAQAAGFHIARETVEVLGYCAPCASSKDGDTPLQGAPTR